MHIPHRWLAALIAVACLSASSWAIAQSVAPSSTMDRAVHAGTHAGVRAEHAVHALTNARLVLTPGTTLERGTLLVRDGRIVAVGATVAVPADAVVSDVGGRTIFAGFIDAQSDYGQPAEGDDPQASTPSPGAAPAPAPTHANSKVFPDNDPQQRLRPDAARAASLRRLGFTSVLSQPRAGSFRGQATLLSTADAARTAQLVVAARVAQVLAFETNPVQSERYPVFPGGATALVRQTLMDADWQRRYQAWQMAAPARARRQAIAPEPALTALEAVVAGTQPVIFQAPGELDAERAQRVADEFGLRWIVMGNGYEYRHVAALKRSGGVIVPLLWPEAPDVSNDDVALDAALEDLEHWEAAPYNAGVLAAAGVRFSLSAAGLAKAEDVFWPRLRDAVRHGLDEQAALAALTTAPAAMLGIDTEVGALAPGLRAQFVVADADLFRSPQARIHEVWIDGVRHAIEPQPVERQPVESAEATVADTVLPASLQLPRFPAGVHGRTGLPEQPEALLVRHATIWTQGPQGVLREADMLVERGRIRALGQGLQAPAGAVEIDARGLHLAPGIIDAHSHIAQNRGRAFTEASDVVTAEVRTQDMLDPGDISIYRQLSDGVTSVQLLQGSANPIGGQAQLIKLRWGSDGEGLRLADAPASMKFALGENAKQSNWGSGKRFPLTRMGVQDVLRDAFASARAYTAGASAAASTPDAAPWRRDLRLEGVADVLSGRSIAHIHSYRQDEMLGFLRLAREYGIVPVFQHAAEAYKIAPELAAAGAGASTFADYWGTKMEAADGTPYAMALLQRQGVVVSLNSDSTGGVVRLNHAAARAVRFGGLSEIEALDLVTRNPARQLRVDDRIGSLEVGKDADFVLWSDAPLSTRAVPQQTWIDGRRYFDVASDLAEQLRIDRERARLIAKVRARTAGGEE